MFNFNKISKNMLIIIEGCDGTGKTTLANKLIEDFKFSYNKENKPPYDGFKYYIDRATSFKSGDNIILDRFHLGEIVYPSIKKDRTPLDLTKQHLIERALIPQNTLLILGKTSKDFIINTFNTRGETYVNEDEIDEIVRLFDIHYKESFLNKIIYDVEKFNYNEIKYKIEELSKIENKVYKFEGSGAYLNNPIMLVGDQYADDSFVDKHDRMTFISNNNSSYYLHDALELTKNPKDYYLTNSRKYENDDLNLQALQEEVEYLKPKKVIALGNKSSVLLKKAKIEHIKVEHPQYRRRFKFKQINEYANKLN